MTSADTARSDPTREAKVSFRAPELADGAAVWHLARDSGALDLNSPYAYLLWCDRFGDSSVVAEVDGEPAGFVCGFRPPRRPDVLFVWQVAVSAAHRGHGLAARMLDALLERDASIAYVEATVTPSNEASQRLFRGLARRHGCPCGEEPWASAEHFPEPGHEPETLFRIGPFEAAR